MNIIVVLCDNWQDSCDSFDIFVDYLERFSPDSLLECYEWSNIVDTIEYDRWFNDDVRFRYIFADYRYEDWFLDKDAHITDKDTFFEGCLEFYQWTE